MATLLEIHFSPSYDDVLRRRNFLLFYLIEQWCSTYHFFLYFFLPSLWKSKERIGASTVDFFIIIVFIISLFGREQKGRQLKGKGRQCVQRVFFWVRWTFYRKLLLCARKWSLIPFPLDIDRQWREREREREDQMTQLKTFTTKSFRHLFQFLSLSLSLQLIFLLISISQYFVSLFLFISPLYILFHSALHFLFIHSKKKLISGL